MKKLLTLIAVTMITLSLSAKHYHKPSIEDIEVFKTLTELKAGGDIILPEIHVIAYVQQDTIIPKKLHERRMNHGSVVSDSARMIQGSPEKGQQMREIAKQRGVQQQNREKVHNQAKPTNRTGAKPVPHGTTPSRTHNTQRGGRK